MFSKLLLSRTEHRSAVIITRHSNVNAINNIKIFLTNEDYVRKSYLKYQMLEIQL